MSPQHCVTSTPASFRLTERGFGSRFACIQVISFTLLGPDGRSLVGHQLLGRLVETDHGMVGVVVLMVQVQHVLHSSHELSAHLRAPFRKYTASTKSKVASRPSGASLQAMATKYWQSVVAGQWCTSDSQPLLAHVHWTVDALINSPLAMSRSIRPSSAFSNTSARLTLRAEVSPRLTISFRSSVQSRHGD